MIRSELGALPLLAAVAIGCSQLLSCERGECPNDPLRSGTYVVTDVRETRGDGTWGQLEGADVVVDRDAQVATITYEREGTTYEVRYSLSP